MDPVVGSISSIEGKLSEQQGSSMRRKGAGVTKTEFKKKLVLEIQVFLNIRY